LVASGWEGMRRFRRFCLMLKISNDWS